MTIIDQEKAKALFESEQHQADVLIGLYKLVYPDWDAIQSVDGFPNVNDATWKKICVLFQAFDAKYHPNVLPGGAWLNNGFSSRDNSPLRDWEVDPAPVTYMEH